MKLKSNLLLFLLLLTTGLSTHATEMQFIEYISGDWRYHHFGSNKAVLTGYEGADAGIEIPSSFGNRVVTAIGDGAFKDNTTITSVTVPKGVTSIGHDAFFGCSSLTKVAIPSSFLAIGTRTSIYLSNELTSIGERAFYGCSSIKSVRIPDNVTAIEESCFFGCTSLTTVYIPNVVSTIGTAAFKNCSSLRSLSAPTNTPSLFTQFKFPHGINTMGSQSFYGCSSITRITIPKTIKSIEGWAFFLCANLSSAEFLGDAPDSFRTNAFGECAADFKISYQQGSNGWTTPSWKGYSTEELGSTPEPNPGPDEGGEETVPEITQNPSSQTIDLYQSVTFSVQATSSSMLNYQWIKDGNEIADATNASYTIISAADSHAGEYYCQVSNDAGIVNSEIANLTVSSYTKIPLYRFGRNGNPSHFFTASEAEKEAVLERLPDHFTLEDISHYVVAQQKLNAMPVYRMYNSLSGAHFYTASEVEKNNVLSVVDYFSLEGVAFYVFLFPEPGTLPVYRFYVPQTGSHFFTISEAVKNDLISSGQQVLNYDGIAWYAYPSAF